MTDAGGPSKAALRAELLARRAARSVSERAEAAAAFTQQVLALPEMASPRVVTAYVATGGEPDTAAVLSTLREREVTVLLPLLRPDFDLDWAAFDDHRSLHVGRFGILEPTTPPLGVDAIETADVVLCPGVAADLAGWRLGRGGGSYDRVLSRLGPQVLTAVLLYDDEVLADVPHATHDRPVDVIVTPTRVLTTSARL